MGLLQVLQPIMQGPRPDDDTMWDTGTPGWAAKGAPRRVGIPSWPPRQLAKTATSRATKLLALGPLALLGGSVSTGLRRLEGGAPYQKPCANWLWRA